MSEYDPPREIVPIFNPVDWLPFGTEALTVAEGDGRYLKLTGGVEKGSVTFNQGLTSQQPVSINQTLSGVANPILNLTSNSDDAPGVYIDFYKNSQTPAVGDRCGVLTFQGNDSNLDKKEYARFRSRITDPTAGSHDGEIDLFVANNSVMTSVLQVQPTQTNIQNSLNVNGNLAVDTNVLFVDGVNNRVGVNTSSPTTALDVSGTLRVSGSSNSTIINTSSGAEIVPLTIFTPNLTGGQTNTIRFGVNESSQYNSCQYSFYYAGNASSSNRAEFGFYGIGSRAVIRGDGNVGINLTDPARTLHIRGDSIRFDRSGSEPGIQLHRYAGVGGYTTIWKGFQIVATATGVNTGDFQIQDYGTATSGGGTRRFTIGNTGNCGIGSNITSPAYGLEVEGSIASRTGYIARAGPSGAFGNIFNFNWVNPNMDLWVDTTRIGSLLFSDRYVAGQVIQYRVYDPSNTTPSAYVFNANFYVVWLSVSFTPKSSTSKIVVDCDAWYTMDGNATVAANDTWYIAVMDNGVMKYEKPQQFRTGDIDNRSGVLLPLHATFTSSGTTARTITIQVQRNAADDILTFTNGVNSNWSLTIQEIAV